MKKFFNKIWMAILLVTAFSCVQEDNTLSELQGTLRFVGISLDFVPMGSPGSRITENSPWVHVFPNSADLIFINKATGQQYVQKYNPNDFSLPYSIDLPFGEYEYYSIVEGGTFSAFLPFEARGEFSLTSQSLEITLEAATEYGLVTVKNQYVGNAAISDGVQESDLAVHQDNTYWFLYVKGGTAATLNIRESIQGTTISRELNIEANKHYNFILTPNEDGASIIGLILAPFELVEEKIPLGFKLFFEENGIIKCPGASPGEKGRVNEKVYEAVDGALLYQRKYEGADLSCVCTSLVTDMSYLFYFDTNFNQAIGNWDVSNVTNMNSMFLYGASFNQPLGNWDVSNVRDMGYMFYYTGFNQAIGNWDVSNVTNMTGMFAGVANFNQSIGNWDVSNVTNMNDMFYSAASFNQAIGNWDVSKVTSMSGMFGYAASFNQPIGNWNVSNVTEMAYMFSYAASFNQPIGLWDVGNVLYMYAMFQSAINFNQPLGDWDVGNVMDMSSMFYSAINFNQDLSPWCVQNIPSEPGGFSTASALQDANKPVWGTCPG